MFSDCRNLEKINFGNINTSSLENMWALFQRCSKLESIDLSIFDTSKVKNMESVFYECSNLKYVNLSNINASEVTNINNMFYGCNSLIYLDLNTLKSESSNNLANIFNGITQNVIFCIKDDDTKSNLLGTDKIAFCSDECYNINNSKIDISNEKCVESCFKSNNKYEYNNFCNNKFPDGSLLDNFLCLDNPCEENNDNSLECQDGKPLGYYLDSIEKIYKKCFDSCNLCYGEGNETNNNCIECKINYRFLNDEPEYENNCYTNCAFYYYFDESSIYHCTENEACPDKYQLITQKRKCVNIQDQKFIDEIINECLNDNSSITKCYFKDKYNNSEIYDILINEILSTYSSESDKNIIIEGEEDIVFQITNEKNEKDLIEGNITSNYNLSIIDLAKCETLLKEEYAINENDSLIFIKQEKLSNITSEKDIKYECYDPYNKTKLNLSICSGVDINIYVKLELSSDTKLLSDQLQGLGYNMFDINDQFYQDVCTPYKSEKADSDIILKDRVDYIFYNNDAQCPNMCEFFSYFLGSLYINCSCTVNNEETTEIKKIDKLNAKTFFESFYFVLKYSNYKCFKCHELVFNKNVVTKNIGSIIIIVFFLLNLACLIIYIIKGITSLKIIIENIVEENGKIIPFGNIISVPPRKMKMLTKKQKKDMSRNITQSEKYDTDKNYRLKFNSEKSEELKNSLYSNEIMNNNNNIKQSKSTKKISKFRKKEEKKDEINMEEVKIENKQNDLDDFELNELPYSQAAISDKRTFWQIYISLLKREHMIIFTFFNWKDYNLIIIKLSRFVFLLATDMAMNVFFFSDATMHKIFLNYGKYDFIQQIPQIIYSTIISQLIQLLLKFLSHTDKHIYQIKKLNPKLKVRKKIMDIIKCIKIKLIFYFIFIFVFSGFYWYIISAFCGVYENTQTIFLLDAFISFILNNIYPFILYLVLSLLRICVRRCKKNNTNDPNIN